MLAQLKTLLNTPGKTYADLMADVVARLHPQLWIGYEEGRAPSWYHAEQAPPLMVRTRWLQKRTAAVRAVRATRPR